MNNLFKSVEWSLAHAQRATQPRVTEMFRVGASVIDRQTGRVESPRGEQRLRAKELDLLAHLYQHPTVTFTREQLLQQVWNLQPGLLTRTVDQTVATLRRKIETKPKQPRFLQTVYGIGYRLICES